MEEKECLKRWAFSRMNGCKLFIENSLYFLGLEWRGERCCFFNFFAKGKAKNTPKNIYP